MTVTLLKKSTTPADIPAPAPAVPAATLGNGDDLLTERQAAAVLNVKPATLRNDRAKGQGLPYVKIGALVRYTRADIMTHIAANRHVPGAAAE